MAAKKVAAKKKNVNAKKVELRDLKTAKGKAVAGGSSACDDYPCRPK